MQYQFSKMESCIEECLRCYSTCLGMLMNYCLEATGKRREPEHVRIMRACAEMRQTSAAMMLFGMEHHKHTCRECAETCEDCATSCEQVGDLGEYVQQCHRCGESCRSIAVQEVPLIVWSQAA